jgi:hypothetical protein
MADKELISRGRGPVGASDPRCPSSPTLTGHNQASSAVRVTRPAACRSPRSVPDPKAASKASWPRRTAGLRAFSPCFPLTQRNAVYLHNLEADLRPIWR